MVLALLTAHSAAAAQDTHAAPSNAEQAVPAAPRPEPSTAIEKVRDYVEKNDLVERLTSGDGVYPRFGGLTSGSGIAAGAGYRTHLTGTVFTDVSGVISTNNSKAFDAKARWATLWGNRIELWSAVAWRDLTEEDFYGVGLDTRPDMRTDYALRTTDVSGRALTHLMPRVDVGLDVGGLFPTVSRGRDEVLPATQDRFTDAEAPGLGNQPTFAYTRLFTEIDYRDKRGDPHRGGYVNAGWGVWRDRAHEFDFDRFDLEVAHFIPLAPRHVVALHTELAFANNKPGERIPFYLLPVVGGNNSIRAFDNYRFRGENSFYMNAEYRYDLFKYVELAGFIDAGEVRADWEDIGFGGLLGGYGGGVRVKAMDQVIVRFDVANGAEGPAFILKLGKAF